MLLSPGTSLQLSVAPAVRVLVGTLAAAAIVACGGTPSAELLEDDGDGVVASDDSAPPPTIVRTCTSDDDCGAPSACQTAGRCSTSGRCVYGLAESGTVCRPSTGACDAAESCDGTSPACPEDGPLECPVPTCDPNARPFGLGSGTETDPYQLCASGHLAAIAEAAGAHFILVRDLDLTGADGFPIGAEDDSQPFTGVLDGLGHTLRGLRIEESEPDSQGLFRIIEGATVRNLRIADAEIVGNNFVGALAGKIRGATVEDLELADVSVRGRAYVGGGAGVMQGIATGESTTTFRGFRATGLVLSSSFDGSWMQNNAPTGSNSDAGIGAVVGSQDNIYGPWELKGHTLVIRDADVRVDASTTATTETLKTSWAYVGGLVGYTGRVDIANVVVRGRVQGVWNVGGLIGHEDYGPAPYSFVADAAIYADVSGVQTVGGVMSASHSIKIDRVVYVGTVTAEKSHASTFGWGCGIDLDGAYVQADVTAPASTSLLILNDCVGRWENAFVVGTVRGADTMASLSTYGWSTRTARTSLTIGRLVASDGTNVHPAIGYPVGGTNDVAAIYHWNDTAPDATDPFSVGLAAEELAIADNLIGFDFANVWTMATDIPGYSGGHDAPVPQFACGQVPGLACR